MDGDRPVVDGRDIFESKLQELVREAIEEAWEFGKDDLPDPSYPGYAEATELLAKCDKKLHELLISYLDSPTSDVGSQDEASEEGTMGDRVRSKGYLKQLTNKEPDEISISEDGKTMFKIWHGSPWSQIVRLPQNYKPKVNKDKR